MNPLTKYRSLAGLTKSELAARAGITREQVYHLENGKQKPKLETLGKLAAALNVDFEILVNEVGTSSIYSARLKGAK